MFKSIFDRMVQENPSIHLVGVWGKDGLEIEKAIYQPSLANTELLGAEIADVVSRMECSSVASGPFRFEYRSGNKHILAFSLTSQFFLVVLGDKDLWSGKVALAVDSEREQLLASL